MRRGSEMKQTRETGKLAERNKRDVNGTGQGANRARVTDQKGPGRGPTDHALLVKRAQEGGTQSTLF